MNELVGLVEKWSIDKKLDEADSSKQFLKVSEEVGEVAAALARNDKDMLRDGIGDVVVTLIILAQQNDMDLYECLNTAYDEIKGRKGKMVNGIFVKESDLESELKIIDGSDHGFKFHGLLSREETRDLMKNKEGK